MAHLNDAYLWHIAWRPGNSQYVVVSDAISASMEATLVGV